MTLACSLAVEAGRREPTRRAPMGVEVVCALLWERVVFSIVSGGIIVVGCGVRPFPYPTQHLKKKHGHNHKVSKGGKGADKT